MSDICRVNSVSVNNNILTNWNGASVVKAPLTDLLLWIESKMEEEEGAFIQCIGSHEIEQLLHGNPLIVDADALLFTSPLFKNIASFSSETPFTMVNEKYFLQLLLELAADNALNIAFLTNGEELPVDEKFLYGRRVAMYDCMKMSAKEVAQELYLQRTDLVISSWELKDSMNAYHGSQQGKKNVLWIQLPGSEKTEKVPIANKLSLKWKEAMLAYQLLLSRSIISSGSK